MPETLSTAEEKKMIGRVKVAIDLVGGGLSPDDAIIKVARDGQLSPGAVEIVCRAYNTGRQLGQWRNNDSILDKLASFPLADPAKVLAAVYPKARTLKEAHDAAALSPEYARPPDWLADRARSEVLGRDLPGMIKAGHYPGCGSGRKRKRRSKRGSDDACEECGNSPCTCEDKEADGGACPKCGCYPCACDGPRGDDYGQNNAPARGGGGHKHGADECPHCGNSPCTCEEKCSDDLRVRRAWANLGRAKVARDEARRHAESVRDRLQEEVAALVGYFKKAGYDRLSFADVEHAARAYRGPAAVDLLGIAYAGARLREPRAAAVGVQKLAFDLAAPPFTIIDEAIDLAGRLIEARRWAKEAADLFDLVEAALRPFAPAPAATGLRLFEKAAFLPGFVTTAMGNAAGTYLGGGPKTSQQLVEDEWLDLESPEHMNELRKIKAHAMLNSMLTDPDDPISGNDPDRVLAAYNEIAQAAPRAADNAAVLKPLLRKRLAGNVEPFEAKELVDIEKGLRDVKNVPPSTESLVKAPNELLG
jgi:hypothetical protein